ncbi:MAG: hypothetical protein [Bacteriophage sp.]|nr:MAG: hypothetical protein [Bacteriophage sp.]
MGETIFNVNDIVQHKYTKERLKISSAGTGNGKISIACVNATKSVWELINHEERKENNMDSYRVGVMKQMLEGMDRDEYYLARLKGDDTKTINLEREDIEMLIARYEKEM